ncbi:helix-turn-helix protein [anaerobic digester metagenome]
MEIEKKIRKVRELRNFSQEYMAIQLGISQVAYSKIETGLTRLDLKRLEKIAETLDIDPFTLMSFDDKYIFNNHGINNQGGNQSGTIVNHYHAEKNEKLLLIERVEKVEHEITKLNEKIYKLIGGGL